MDTVKEYATFWVAIVTLLLVGSIKMEQCKMKRGHAQVEKHEGRRSSKRHARVERALDSLDRGSKGDSGRGAWVTRPAIREAHPRKK
tara:strand:+ start:64 stop:324 length:261 start_codon:yes stop_codon:yes gene_type:complete